jgi:SRSO17 transposase
MAHRFEQTCKMLEHHFRVQGHDVSGHARHYLSGLPGTRRRRNLERIEADAERSDYQGLRQFISDSPWKHEAVMARVGTMAEESLGGAEETAL